MLLLSFAPRFVHFKDDSGKVVVLNREETSEQAAVLHFTYNRFEDLKSRRDRCDCAPTEEDAKRCFILPFDRMVRAPWCA